MRERINIVDRRAAAVFAAPRQRKILLCLVAQERSLSQVSLLTGAPLNLLHHHIRKFMQLGLVRVVRVEIRPGAPIKHYRATARAFFVPAELMEADPGTGLSSQMRDLLARNLARGVHGVVYSDDGKGPRMQLVRDPDPRATAVELWEELHLNAADAASLAGELRALLHRFQARSRKPYRRYLIHAALVSTAGGDGAILRERR